MKTKLLALMLLAASTMLAAPRVAIGIGIGAPAHPRYVAPAPPPVAVVAPPCPGPGYAWVAGYWGPSHVWVNGYWAAPRVAPYRGVPLRGYVRGYAYGHRR